MCAGCLDDLIQHLAGEWRLDVSFYCSEVELRHEIGAFDAASLL
jgi:hypothetical protein